MADKCIGKLYLDISQVKKDINEVNEFLGKIGANINLEDKLSKKISSALNNLVSEAKKAGEEAQKAISRGLSADVSVATYDKMMQKVLAAENKMQAEADKTLAKMEQRAEKEAAIIEKSEERKRAAREKQEAAYEQVWKKAEQEQEKRRAAEEARIDREVAKAEAAAEKKIAAEEKIAAKQEAARAKQEAAYDEMWHKAELRREQEAAAEEARIDREVARAEEAAMLKARAEEEAAAKQAAARAKQEADYQAVWDKATYEQRQAQMRQYQQDIENYAKALSAYFNEINNLQKLIASGRITEGSEAYKAAIDNIERLKVEAQSAGENLDYAGKQAAAGMQNVKNAVGELSKSAAAMRDAENMSALTQIETAYKQLTTAIRDYNTAKKANNEEGMISSQKQIDNAMQTVGIIEQGIRSLHVDEATRERILYVIEQCKIQQDAHAKGMADTTKATGDLENQVKGLVTRYLSLMAVIRTISSVTKNMVEYVSEYSDKMNEIQMITMKSDEEVAQLADTYRGLAKDMSVSSLDMADAAIYFTRQGLGAAEIEKRLKNVTMYAKAANVEFKDASEIITAVVNSMGLVEEEAEDGRDAAQRVADVFLNIGDHAATSGQEIGEAMQKAAASAGAFGVSMEWLASYIATVSETTRQEARTIGTAFNTIIARLHQIKQTGYNQEDETKVNDIAKALSKIDVVLLDQEGNWRDMEDILEEIAKKWGDLDGKTKSYIATTMAGVKQQNVFLALMNDMSKGVENNSRAYALHELAVHSNGIAEQKYGVYLDSVTASQERLTVAQEKFYSILSQNVIIDWNNAMSGFVGMIADGAEAWGNWTVIVPVVAGAIAGLLVAIKSVNRELSITASIMKIINEHPIMLAISAAIVVMGSLVTIINAVATAGESADEKLKRISNTISDSNGRISEYKSMLGEFDSMMQVVGEDSKMTSDEIEKYNGLLLDISKISPKAAEAVEALKNNLIDQKDAYELINNEIQKYIANEQAMQAMALYEKAGVKQDKTESENLAISMLTNGDALARYLGDISDEIYDEMSSYLESGFDWGTIERIISDKYLEGLGASDYLKKNAEALIDEYVDVIGMAMNDIDKSKVRSTLASLLFGDDGILDLSEYENMGNVVQDFLKKAIEVKFDPGELVGSKERIEAFGEYIFGDLFEIMFGDQLDEIIRDVDADIVSDKIAQAITELMAAGFSDVDIGDVLRNLDLSEWANAVDAMKQHLLEEISKNAGNIDLGFTDVDMITGEETYDLGMWEDLDVSVLKVINDIVLAGTELTTIQRIMNESSSVDEFVEKLNELAGTVEDTADNNEKVAVSITDLVKAAKAGLKDIRALDAAIKDVTENGSDFNYSDMLGVAEAHPEIWTLIGDTDALLKKLKELRAEANNKQREGYKEIMMSQKGAMAGSKYAGKGFDTLGEYRASLTDEDEKAAFDAEVEKMLDGWEKANEDAKKVAKEAAAETKQTKKEFSDTVKEVENLDKMIEKLQTTRKVDFSDLVNLSSAHPEILGFAGDIDVLLAKLQELKASAEGDVKEALKSILLDSEEFYKNSEFYDANNPSRTMRQYIEDRNASGGHANEDWEQAAAAIDAAADNIKDAAERTGEAAESWLEAQAEIARINEEVSWAKANDFKEQITQLQTAMESGGIEGAIDVFDKVWSKEMQEAVGKEYPAFIKAMGDAKKAMREQGKETADLTKQTNEMRTALKNASQLNDMQYFKETAKAIKQLSEGTISATDAYEVFDKEVNKVSKSWEDILDVQNKQQKGLEVQTSDVANLADLLGMSAEEILQDFPGAIDLFDELTGSSGELTDALNALNAAAFVKITGVSEADFSNIENGLFAIRADAEDTIALLEATGQWEVVPIDLPQTAKVWDAFAKKWVTAKEVAKATVLKATGNNPFARSTSVRAPSSRSSGGGGGGGGSKREQDDNFRDRNTTTEVEKMLDLMSQVNSIQQAQQNWYQSQQKYYQQTGQLQGVIAYMEKEKEALEAQNKTVEQNIKQIEEHMAKKRAELVQLSMEDEKYEEVADDLDKLQKAHQTYSKQLVDSKTAIEGLNKAMDEQRKKIRQMEIDLRNTILKAIEDREEKNKNMLNAEIQMENIIIDLLKKRYEKERDDILETTRMKIDALQEERDLLDEQLRLRKEQADEEDKQKKLAELEAQYQRIIADPTRTKEAQGIRTEIDELRTEMAWDTAEKEVAAQQESIDQQIKSLEDYEQYIEDYYEDLFNHPKKLIEEMQEIMKLSQEDLIDWLKTTDEEYQDSSEKTQQSIVEGWTQTYDDMKGIVKTHWDEVEEIIAKGDDYIIEFLKEHSAEYASAGKLQAEAYVEQWRQQLDDLSRAHEAVSARAAASYAAIEQAARSAAAAASGYASGGSRTSGSTSSRDDGGDNKKYHVRGTDQQGRQTIMAPTYDTEQQARSAMQKAQMQGWSDMSISYYANGGLANYTGLAWLDGSRQDPKRVLSPYQTKLFETMVSALERMSTISVPSMPNIGSVVGGTGNNMSFGDIIVNVDNLDTDDDYEELAQKVSDVLMERIGQTAVVGGIRVTSF